MLIHEKNNPDITIGETIQKADIGRSKLFRYYQSKAQVLLDIHRDIFEQLFSVSSFSEAWLNQDTPPEWISFLSKYQCLGRNPFLLSYKLCNDLDYLITYITGLLTQTIQTRLQSAYTNESLSIPIPILAQAVSASFSGLVMSWFIKFQFIDAEKFATFTHRSIGALVHEATENSIVFAEQKLLDAVR